MSTLSQAARTAGRPHGGAAKQALVNLRRRRTYLIDPNTQFTITRQFMFVLLAACALSVGNYHVAQTMLDVDRVDSVSLVMTYGYVTIMLAISVALLVLLCVFFSHRIAGPAFKISEALNLMAQGDLCIKVRLRDTDLLKGLADGVNATNRELRSSLSELEREVRRARSLAGDHPELAACLQRAERQLAGFRLTNATEMDAREAASRGVRTAVPAAAGSVPSPG